MRRLAAMLALTASAACSPDGGMAGGPGSGGGYPTISVRGRVVDVESCAEGCEGVAGIRVVLAGSIERESDITGADGAFVLEGVAAGARANLLAIPLDTAAARFAPTLNPMAVRPEDDADVFGLELYVLPRGDGSILGGVQSEADLDLIGRGGYVGQAVTVEGAVVTAASGVSVNVYPPQGAIRFVNVLPRRTTTEPVLTTPETTSTTSVGMFVVAGTGAAQDPVAIAPYMGSRPFDLVVTPIVPGFVSFAVHAGR